MSADSLVSERAVIAARAVKAGLTFPAKYARRAERVPFVVES